MITNVELRSFLAIFSILHFQWRIDFDADTIRFTEKDFSQLIESKMEGIFLVLLISLLNLIIVALSLLLFIHFTALQLRRKMINRSKFDVLLLRMKLSISYLFLFELMLVHISQHYYCFKMLLCC